MTRLITNATVAVAVAVAVTISNVSSDAKVATYAAILGYIFGATGGRRLNGTESVPKEIKKERNGE